MYYYIYAVFVIYAPVSNFGFPLMLVFFDDPSRCFPALTFKFDISSRVIHLRFSGFAMFCFIAT